MAVPSQQTAAVGGKVTASLWNDDVRDTGNFLIAPPRCSVYHSANVSVSNITWAVVAFDSEQIDSGGASAMHDTATNNSRVFARDAGRFEIKAGTSWATGTAGARLLQVRKNAAGSQAGGTFLAQSGCYVSGADQGPQLAYEAALAAGDYIELFVWQSSGGSLTLTGGDGITWLGLRWLATS